MQSPPSPPRSNTGRSSCAAPFTLVARACTSPGSGFLSSPRPGTLAAVKARSPTPPAPQDPATDAVRQPPLVSLLTELLQGYRRPAIAITDKGSIVCSSPAATRIVNRQPDESIPADPSGWPRRAAFQADGVTLYLVMPDKALDVSLPDPQHIPPRLAKIARLVISGCTDKQIASQTGLTFATVRTYVRQIYRRLKVHTRVELVNLSLARE
jgi:DNA-binding CsgD family transcriptional regulator